MTLTRSVTNKLRSAGLTALTLAWISNSVAAESFALPASLGKQSALVKQFQFAPELSDEFEQSSLDMDKWENGLPSWGGWQWVAANAFVKNNVLMLKGQASSGQDNATAPTKEKQQRLESGIIRSRAPALHYGYLEARIKGVDHHPGLSPGFWLFTNRKDYWGEIDVIEMQGGPDNQFAGATLHLMRKQSEKRNEHVKIHQHLPFAPDQDFHVYGCLWTEKSITIFIDGKNVGERANTHWDQPMDVVLSMGFRPPYTKQGNTEPKGGPDFVAHAQIDYVRVWRLEKKNSGQQKQ